MDVLHDMALVRRVLVNDRKGRSVRLTGAEGVGGQARALNEVCYDDGSEHVPQQP